MGVALAFREPARGRQWNQCCQGKEFLASCSKTRTAAPSTACPSPCKSNHNGDRYLTGDGSISPLYLADRSPDRHG